MHHSPQGPSEEFRKAFGLGATGKFPEGKLTPADEGEIKLAIGHKGGKVVIDFGTQVVWIGFTPNQAEEIAQTLLKHADAARTGG